MSTHSVTISTPIERGTMDFTNPEFKKAYQMGFNDGYTSAVANAQEEHGLTEDQADDLLTELVEIDR